MSILGMSFWASTPCLSLKEATCFARSVVMTSVSESPRTTNKIPALGWGSYGFSQLIWSENSFTTIHNPRFAYTKHLTLATKLAFVFTFWAEHCAKIRTLHDSNGFVHQLNSRPWNKTCNEDVDTPKKPLYSHHPGLKFNLYHQGQACKHILSQLHSHSTQLFQQTCVVPHDLTVAISGGK